MSKLDYREVIAQKLREATEEENQNYKIKRSLFVDEFSEIDNSLNHVAKEYDATFLDTFEKNKNDFFDSFITGVGQDLIDLESGAYRIDETDKTIADISGKL